MNLMTKFQMVHYLALQEGLRLPPDEVFRVEVVEPCDIPDPRRTLLVGHGKLARIVALRRTRSAFMPCSLADMDVITSFNERHKDTPQSAWDAFPELISTLRVMAKREGQKNT